MCRMCGAQVFRLMYGSVYRGYLIIHTPTYFRQLCVIISATSGCITTLLLFWTRSEVSVFKLHSCKAEWVTSYIYIYARKYSLINNFVSCDFFHFEKQMYKTVIEKEFIAEKKMSMQSTLLLTTASRLRLVMPRLTLIRLGVDGEAFQRGWRLKPSTATLDFNKRIKRYLSCHLTCRNGLFRLKALSLAKCFFIVVRQLFVIGIVTNCLFICYTFIFKPLGAILMNFDTNVDRTLETIMAINCGRKLIFYIHMLQRNTETSTWQ